MATFTTGEVFFQRVNVLNEATGAFNLVGSFPANTGVFTEVSGDDADETQVFTDQFGTAPTTPTPLRQFLAGDSDPSDEGADNDEFVTINGVDYNYIYLGEIELAVGTRGQTETFAFIEVIGLQDGNNPNTIYATNLDNPLNPANGRNSASLKDLQPVEIVICFASGTLIRMETGKKPVEQIEIGDHVVTLDGTTKPVRWVGSSTVQFDSAGKREHLRPIRICAGALGENMPSRDLLVSPQHRVLLRNWRAELMFGESEVLVAAKALVNNTTIVSDHRSESVTYVHFLCDEHELVEAEGLWTESLFPGPMALASVHPDGLNELLQLFPGLTSENTEVSAKRPNLKAYEARALVYDLFHFN